jgi:hypothetical protein
VTVVQVSSAPSISRSARCCPAHADWPTLAEHLISEFSDARPALVVRELRDARQVVTSVGLRDAEALEVAEVIARHRLKLAAGLIDDVARLDPQPRTRA